MSRPLVVWVIGLALSLGSLEGPLAARPRAYDQQDASHPREGRPARPPGAIRVISFDRQADHLAICGEVPGGPVETGSRAIPRTKVWVGIPGGELQEAGPHGACDPDWSPDGLQVVMAAPTGLWVLSRDLTKATHLVNHPSSPTRATEFDYRAVSQPAWAPDGSRIAFLVSNGGTSWVEVVDARSGQLLFKSEAEVYAFRWEPGSRSLRLGTRVVEMP